MHTHQIHLPEKTHYRLEEIAEAIEGFPPQAGMKKGIDCVDRKYLPKNFWLKKPDYSRRLKGLVSSTPLTAEDKVELGRLLPLLPEITDNMSDEEIDIFFDEYYKIQNRPNWEPGIQAPSDRQKKQDAYDKRITEHCQNFISKVQSGHYHLFDSDYNVLRGVDLHPYFAQKHALVTREDASKYLKQMELDFTISNTKRPKGPSNKPWTAEEIAELRFFKKNHTTRETAAYFGIASSRVYQVLNKELSTKDSQLKTQTPKGKKKPSTHSKINIDIIWAKPIKK
jgi:hypothetical protein